MSEVGLIIIQCVKANGSVAGFSRFIGICSVLEAELWGILEGLRLCQANGWRNVVVQVDFKVACTVIQDDGRGWISGFGLVREIRLLMESEMEVRIEHIYREANRCADVLASLSYNQLANLIIF